MSRPFGMILRIYQSASGNSRILFGIAGSKCGKGQILIRWSANPDSVSADTGWFRRKLTRSLRILIIQRAFLISISHEQEWETLHEGAVSATSCKDGREK